MQNAKDTFYTMLQTRLAALNPARTIVVRGVIRPGTLVAENELPTALIATDAFRLEWTALHITAAAPLPWVAIECALHYATDGDGGSVMARGRALASMDAELAAALAAEPHSIAKINYAGAAPVTMATKVFWADPIFSPATVLDGRLARTATVQVFAYQEAGEL